MDPIPIHQLASAICQDASFGSLFIDHPHPTNALESAPNFIQMHSSAPKCLKLHPSSSNYDQVFKTNPKCVQFYPIYVQSISAYHIFSP